MLIVSTSQRSSLFVPIAFVLLTGAMLVASTLGALEKPSIGAAFSLLLSLAFFAFVLSMIVFARVEGDRLVARSLFGAARTCAHASAAIGFRVSTGSKGGNEYVVQASDGTASIELATAWTRRGATRDVGRLSTAFGIGDEASRARARDALAASLAAWDRDQAEARARLAATYTSASTWKAAAVVVLVMAIAYAIVLAVVMTGE